MPVGALTLIVIVAALLVIGLGALFGWERYRGRARSSTALRPTTEVFLDPETGQRMRVWFDDRTGEREYRPE